MNEMIKQNNNQNWQGDQDSFKEVPPAFDIMSESLIQIIWRSRWIMLSCIVAALVLAFIYVIKATPIYTSTSRIYVQQSGPKIISENEVGVMTQSNNYLYTQAELLKSTPILAATLEDTDIAGAQTFDRIDNKLVFLKKTLDIAVGKKDDIISVSFKSAYPGEAAQIVNKIVESYVTYQATQKRSTSAEVLKILQTEKEKRSKELTEKLTAMMDFKTANEALAFETPQGNLVIERLSRLSTVLTESQLATIEKKSAYDTVREMIKDPVTLNSYIQAQRNSGLYTPTTREDQLKTKLNDLELQVKTMQLQVKSGHPLITGLQTEIELTKSQITDLENKFVQAQLAVAEQEYKNSQEREQQISQNYETQRQEVLALNQQFAKYTILQSNWEQTKKLSDILDDRIKELNVTEDVGALNISILETARVESKPSEPQKARIMAIALVMGMMLGGGLALLRGWMDQKMHSAEEISTLLNLPVLGNIPSMSKRQSISERGQKVYKDSNSPVAEAYRTIRTAVFFGAPQGKTKTILITSPSGGDGKTTMTSNLGIAMAQSGQKTLIIDADFRKPMQHNIFQVNHDDIGLSSILAGIVSTEKAIKRTEIENLELLTCGPQVPNPSEMLNSETFSKLLGYLSEIYDRIIIDSPPVMPVTDAQIIAAISDITLLVLRAEKSTKKVSQQARDGLLSVGAHLLGAVVNDVSKGHRYGYYSDYGHYYGHYGYDSDKKKKTESIHAAFMERTGRSEGMEVEEKE
jgi:polysaccharide biosynthesis transport protein